MSVGMSRVTVHQEIAELVSITGDCAKRNVGGGYRRTPLGTSDGNAVVRRGGTALP